MQVKKSIIVVFIICMLVIIFSVVFTVYNTKGPETLARVYIEAVKAQDFTTIFDLNFRTQKQVNIIARAKESDQKDLLKKIYVGSETAFKAMVPTSDLTITWAEKFYFIVGMDYKILQTNKETTSSTPSSDYRSKRIARVLVAVSYPNLDQAPAYKGKKLKKARLWINMIQSRDVVKGMQTEAVKEGWLYQWLQVEEGSVGYWIDG